MSSNITIALKDQLCCFLTAGSCCYWWDIGDGDNVQAGCARKAFWDEMKRCALLRGGHCSSGREGRENKYIQVKVVVGFCSHLYI